MSGPDPNIGSLIMGLRYEQAMWPAPKLTKSSIEITRLVCENEHLTDRRIAEIGWNGLKTSKGGVLQFWPHSGVPLLKNLCYSSCHSSFWTKYDSTYALSAQYIHTWNFFIKFSDLAHIEADQAENLHANALQLAEQDNTNEKAKKKQKPPKKSSFVTIHKCAARPPSLPSSLSRKKERTQGTKNENTDIFNFAAALKAPSTLAKRTS